MSSEANSSHFYRVDRAGQVAHRVYVSREFLSDQSPDEIALLFHHWGIAAKIRGAGLRTVTVTNAGVDVTGS